MNETVERYRYPRGDAPFVSFSTGEDEMGGIDKQAKITYSVLFFYVISNIQ